MARSPDGQTFICWWVWWLWWGNWQLLTTGAQTCRAVMFCVGGSHECGELSIPVFARCFACEVMGRVVSGLTLDQAGMVSTRFNCLRPVQTSFDSPCNVGLMFSQVPQLTRSSGWGTWLVYVALGWHKSKLGWDWVIFMNQLRPVKSKWVLWTTRRGWPLFRFKLERTL